MFVFCMWLGPSRVCASRQPSTVKARCYRKERPPTTPCCLFIDHPFIHSFLARVPLPRQGVSKTPSLAFSCPPTAVEWNTIWFLGASASPGASSSTTAVVSPRMHEIVVYFFMPPIPRTHRAITTRGASSPHPPPSPLRGRPLLRASVHDWI